MACRACTPVHDDDPPRGLYCRQCRAVCWPVAVSLAGCASVAAAGLWFAYRCITDDGCRAAVIGWMLETVGPMG